MGGSRPYYHPACCEIAKDLKNNMFDALVSPCFNWFYIIAGDDFTHSVLGYKYSYLYTMLIELYLR